MLMSAKEALEKSQNSIGEKSKEALLAAEKSIQVAVNNGDVSCWCYKHLTPKAIQELEKLGYTVKDCSDQRDGVMYQIKWNA